MENILISTGSGAGIALSIMVTGSMLGDTTTAIPVFIGAMIGATAGGWLVARIIDRVS